MINLKSVHEKLSTIKDTRSINAKISLLKEYLIDKKFKRVIKLMYSDDKHFKVNKLPKFGFLKNSLFMEENIFEFLEKLSVQKGATNVDKDQLAGLASINKETYEVVKRIINKDAKCGFGGKTINKACPDLLFLMPYCRCSTAKNKMHNIDYSQGAFAQEKADGMFINVIIDKKGGVLFRSRNGNIVHQLDHLKEFLKKTPKKFRNTVYMGELLIEKNGKILPRKAGNGVFNSCIQNTADPKDSKYAIIKLWDAVPQAKFFIGVCDITYKTRFIRTKTFIKSMGETTLLGQIRSKIVYSLDEAEAFYKKLRKAGKEGAIIKNLSAKWKYHTSPDQVKMKNVSDAELRIVGWKYGKVDTKFEKFMGSVQLESDDGLIKVSVSGFTDDEHYKDWNVELGQIATIEYDDLITDKSRPGIYSLYLPRNLELRPDRSDTDTLKDLKTR